MIRNKVVVLLLAGIFACAGFTTTASAKEVNTSLATNPTATLSAIDAMNLASLSDEKAGEVRGEFLPAVVVAALGTIFYYGVVYGVPYAVNYGAGLTDGTWIMKETIKNDIKQYFGW